MLRTACVELPFFALQLLLRRNPQWEQAPVVLLQKDRPLAPVLQANRAARRNGIYPGMRYATALAVVPELQAGVVPESDIADGVEEVRELLSAFSPHVEPWNGYPGIFWLDCGGLTRLWGDHTAWACELRHAVGNRGLYARIATGFSRFGTFVAARSPGANGRTCYIPRSASGGPASGGSASDDNAPIHICSTPEQEREYAYAANLDRLPFSANALHRMARLGIHTIRDFLALKPDSIKSRFGAKAAALYHFAVDRPEVPIQGAPPQPGYSGERELPGVTDREVIASCFEPVITELAARLRAAGRRVAALKFTLFEEDGISIRQTITPARPTCDALFLQKLVVLRLYTIVCRVRVVKLSVELDPSEEVPGQSLLFSEPSYEQEALHQAFSVLRAELGNSALVCVRTVDDYLPEEQCAFDVLNGSDSGYGSGGPVSHAGVREQEGGNARQENEHAKAAVRRILFRPAALSGRPPGRFHGPFRVAGKWWKGEMGKSFFFVEQTNGSIMWVYRAGDEYRLQGYVE